MFIYVGEDHHSIQLWEEATEPIIALENPAADMYAWLITRFRGRAQSLFLPVAMPEMFANLSVTTSRS
jgi:hypothetical protein